MSVLIITRITAYTQAQDSYGLYIMTLVLISIPILWLISKWEWSKNLEDGTFSHDFYDVETEIDLQNRRKAAAIKKIEEQSEDTHKEKKEKSEHRKRMVR